MTTHGGGDDFADEQLALRIRTPADLAPARERVGEALDRRGVDERYRRDIVLAMNELLTNALETRDRTAPVALHVTIGTHRTTSERHRRVEIEVTNTGTPFDGPTRVDATAPLDSTSEGGRGLVVAARLGDVSVEGLIGGSRARFRRTLTRQTVD